MTVRSAREDSRIQGAARPSYLAPMPCASTFLHRRRARAVAAIALAIAASPARTAHAAPRTIDEYKHFRALSIDLVGRVPTRREIEAFESKGFDRDAWIEEHLEGPAYADRLTRVYMDLLRLEVGNAIQVNPAATTLRRATLIGPDKKPLYVFYRRGQRRLREATDGDFCLTEDETGLQFTMNNQPPKGTAKPVPKSALEAHTVLVRPWWLYRDFLSVTPSQRYKAEWKDPPAGYAPIDKIVNEPDGSPTVEVRVCREEAQTRDTGTIYASGRTPPPPVPKPKTGEPPAPPPVYPFGRLRPLPVDDAYAKEHKGEPISCRSSLGLTMSTDCGCGVGLQYCMPGDGDGDEPRAFSLPGHEPLGFESPLAAGPQTVSWWHKFWWREEAAHFLRRIFGEDRDAREILTARYTLINGPLAQFYRATAPASCCGKERAFGMPEEREPLFDPAAVPMALFPHDVDAWQVVDDRGPHASGLLTMPAFLEKFASRRARAAALYGAFMCKSFVAENLELTPSTEANLTKRPGCSTCHATLEPLAAYFSRVEETSWTYLPESAFAVREPRCKLNAQGKVPGFCETFYDPSFSDKTSGMLRGAYASAENAVAGPQGIAAAIVKSPEFATCAVERMTASFLGRPLTSDDDNLVKSLAATFVEKGYRMRPLIGAIARSAAYEKANNQRGGAR